MAVDPLQAVREIALHLPEAAEVETWGHPTFRVRNKIFVSFGEADDGTRTISLKPAPGERGHLLATGAPFFVPPYVGSKGWIGMAVGDDTDWRAVAELIIDSYREIAPRQLAVDVGVRPGDRSPLTRAVLAVGNVIGELIEGKPPRDQVVAEDQVDDDRDSGLILDPDDPAASRIEL